MFGFKGPGEVSLASFSIDGPERPRPEFVHVGLWQQSGKPTTTENVQALTEGVRQAANAGVQILLTPIHSNHIVVAVFEELAHSLL